MAKVKTQYGFVVDGPAGSVQRRLLVPFVLGEPLYNVLLRARQAAKAAGQDASTVERTIVKLLASVRKDTDIAALHLGAEVEVDELPNLETPANGNVQAQVPPPGGVGAPRCGNTPTGGPPAGSR